MRGKRNFVWAVGCILAIFLLGGPFILPNFWTWIIIEIMVMSLAAMSVNFLLGYAGVFPSGTALSMLSQPTPPPS